MQEESYLKAALSIARTEDYHHCGLYPLNHVDSKYAVGIDGPMRKFMFQFIVEVVLQREGKYTTDTELVFF